MMARFNAPVWILTTLLHTFICGRSADLSVETVTTISETTITTTTTTSTTEAVTSAATGESQRRITTGCDDTCIGKTNGNYQYCLDCHHYMTCLDGFKCIMPCPSHLVWDDGKKLCYWNSTTCNTPTNNITTATSNTGCHDSCVGKTNGNYQYCPDCYHYMTCVDGTKYIMPCPSHLLWDDQNKTCFWTSSTCTTPTIDTNTASSNTDIPVEKDTTMPYRTTHEAKKKKTSYNVN